MKNIAAILALMLAAGVITYVATQKDDAVGQATATTVATTTTIPKTEPRVFEWLAEQGWTCAEPADWEVEGMACSLSGGPVIVTAQYGLVRLFVYGEGGAFHRSTPGDSVATMIDAGRLFGWDAATRGEDVRDGAPGRRAARGRHLVDGVEPRARCHRRLT
ncbi:MAG: hypothetical protein V9E99_10475 [Microthrixaceae bacterium]